MTDTGSTTTTPPLAAHIAPKIPAFWPQDPELFFVRVEAEFNKASPKITTESTKFSHLVGTLDKSTAALVRNQLLNPDPSEPYSKLKDELIRKFTLSDHSRQAQAKEETLGDQKPSALLCRLQQLLPVNKFSDAQIRDLFISKMPAHVQPVLATMSAQSLETVATTADAVIDFGPPSANINQVSNRGSETFSETSVTDQEIASLRQEVNFLRREIRTQSSRQQWPQSSQQQRRQLPPRLSQQSQCWYHARFGKNALKCVKPCNFQGN